MSGKIITSALHVSVQVQLANIKQTEAIMIILRQKQYSPGFSGIKQVLKKNIDSARMKLAEKLDKSIERFN